MKRTFITLCATALLTAAQAQTIDITYSGNTATVSIPDGVTGVTSAVSGANVSIKAADDLETEYTYRLSGTSSDGSFTLTGKYKLTLQLDGLNLTNAHAGAAIDIECGKRINVQLMEGTVSRLTDSGGSKAKQKAAFYFKGHAEFEGKGTLFVTGKYAHAISAKEYMELKRSLGTINVLGAVKDGLHCGRDIPDPEKNYFMMTGGTVNIMNVQGDGIDSGDYGTIRIMGGNVSVNVGEGASGLKADSIVSISGGNINVAVNGQDAEAIRARYLADISGGTITATVQGDGSKGIKAKRIEPATDPLEAAEQTVTQGGFCNISGGTLDIQVQGGLLITPAADSTPADTTYCMGMSVDADFAQTDGDMTLTALGPDARLYNVKGTETFAGGTFELICSPWVVNAADYQYDMSAYVQVTRNGTPLDTYEGLAVGAFIGDDCVGYAVLPDALPGIYQRPLVIPTSSGESPVGLMRLRSNAVSSSSIAFRLYDYTDGTEQELTPDQAVTFNSQSLVGTPEAPLLLALPAETPDAIEAPIADGSLADGGSSALTNAPRFNLSGQRVGPDYKGIVIINGKKVLQK